MVIDRASVYADRFKGNPQILQAAVLGQSPVAELDAYTALRALQLIKESQRMQMAQAAQNPTQSPSLVQQAMQMPQMPPQIMAQMGQMQGGAPQAPMQAPPQAPMASGGLASMPMPEEDYAGGGIVAFANRGLVEDEDEYSSIEAPSPGGGAEPEIGDVTPGGMYIFADDTDREDPLTQQSLGRATLQSLKAAREAERVAPLTPEQEMDMQARYFKRLKEQSGESPFDAFLAKYNITPEKAAKMDREDLGMALLKAAGAAVQPGGTVRGLAAAAATLGETYGAAKKERRREEMATDRMRAELLDSQRKERMGMSKAASDAMERYRKDRQEAARADANARRLEAQTFAQLTAAFKQPREGAGPKLAEQLAAAEIAFRRDPSEENAQTVDALRKAMDRARTSEYGAGRLGLGETGIATQAETRVSQALEDWKTSVAAREYRKLLRTNPAKAAELEAAQEQIFRRRFGVLSGQTAPAAGAAPAAPAAAPARTPPPPSGFTVDNP